MGVLIGQAELSRRERLAVHTIATVFGVLFAATLLTAAFLTTPVDESAPNTMAPPEPAGDIRPESLLANRNPLAIAWRLRHDKVASAYHCKVWGKENCHGRWVDQ